MSTAGHPTPGPSGRRPVGTWVPVAAAAIVVLALLLAIPMVPPPPQVPARPAASAGADPDDRAGSPLRAGATPGASARLAP